MTDAELLDYFAGCALNGELADSELVGKPEDFTFRAYRYATAMMAERKKHIADTGKMVRLECMREKCAKWGIKNCLTTDYCARDESLEDYYEPVEAVR